MINVIRNSVVRSGFAGPEYQYTRGLSLYFPWSRPVDDFLETYAVYKLNRTRSRTSDLASLSQRLLSQDSAKVDQLRKRQTRSRSCAKPKNLTPQTQPSWS